MVATDALESDAIYIAALLHEGKPTATPSEIARALKDARVYPSLTALQMGTVLKDNQVFPMLTDSQMTQALTDAGYAAPEVQQAVAQLFPQPRQYRRLGPIGVQGEPFDDTSAAQNLGQPLSKITVHTGNIIDAITTFYGGQYQALPAHGGSGGDGTDIVFDPEDVLIEVSGFYGSWYGGNYILQLTFTTRNGKNYGPYGDMNSASTRTPFRLQANANEQVLAFFGSTAFGSNGRAMYLGSLGITVQTY